MKKWIVGIDEVGRGPVAGPVTVAAVAMPLARYKKMKWHLGKKALGDSKQMTVSAREAWHEEAIRLKRETMVRIGLSFRSAKIIDAKGISACIKQCIKSALSQLKLDPNECLVLLDGGLKAPKEYVSQQTIIRGDKSQKIISLAAVVAKVRRDALMRKMHERYPSYGWMENKGYGTRAHMSALAGKGLTPLHRKSFLSKGF